MQQQQHTMVMQVQHVMVGQVAVVVEIVRRFNAAATAHGDAGAARDG